MKQQAIQSVALDVHQATLVVKHARRAGLDCDAGDGGDRGEGDRGDGAWPWGAVHIAFEVRRRTQVGASRGHNSSFDATKQPPRQTWVTFVPRFGGVHDFGGAASTSSHERPDFCARLRAQRPLKRAKWPVCRREERS